MPFRSLCNYGVFKLYSQKTTLRPSKMHFKVIKTVSVHSWDADIWQYLKMPINTYLTACKSGEIIKSWRQLCSKSFPASISLTLRTIENIKNWHYKNFVHLWNYMTFSSLKFNLEPFCLFTNCVLLRREHKSILYTANV